MLWSGGRVPSSLGNRGLFSLLSFNRLGEVHPRRLSDLLHCNGKLIFKKNTFMATSRLVFDHVSGDHVLAMLTPEIHHHEVHPFLPEKSHSAESLRA